MGVPPALRKPWAYAAFPWGELVLALLLLTLPGPLGLVCAVAALVLTLVYLVLVGRALAQPEPVACGCFGETNGRPVSRAPLVRNILLAIAAVAAVAFATRGASVLSALTRDGLWSWILAGALVALLGGVIGYELAPAAALVEPKSDPTPFAAGENSTEPGEYIRRPTPHAVLIKRGAPLALFEVAKRKSILVIWIQPGCSSCRPVHEEAPAWMRQLPQVDFLFAVGRPNVEDYFPEELRDHIVVDHQRQLGGQVGALANPSAVLFGTDGLTAAGPVAGPVAIRELIEDLQDLFDPTSD